MKHLKYIIGLFCIFTLTYLKAAAADKPCDQVKVDSIMIAAGIEEDIISSISGNDLNYSVSGNYTEEDIRQLSAIVFAEAGNQDYIGQQAVAIVVMNRVRSQTFPNSVHEVISQPGQFTPYKKGGFKKALRKYDNNEIPQSCIDAATYALEGNTYLIIDNEIENFNDYLYFSKYIKNRRKKIGDHSFK